MRSTIIRPVVWRKGMCRNPSAGNPHALRRSTSLQRLSVLTCEQRHDHHRESRDRDPRHAPLRRFPRDEGGRRFVSDVGGKCQEQPPHNTQRDPLDVFPPSGSRSRESRQSSAAPELTSMALSSPNPTSETEPAIRPAAIEITPSRQLYAMVKYSSRRPRRSQKARPAASIAGV